MDKIIYMLCAATAVMCAFLLLRAYARSRTRLLLWSGICFALLSVANVLVIVDRMALPDDNLMNIRLGITLSGIVLLLFGLVWERE